MTKIDEIKTLICTEQIKLLGHNILTPYLANAVELLDQLDLKTERDKLKIELADIVFDYFTKLRVANNWHDYLVIGNKWEVK